MKTTWIFQLSPLLPSWNPFLSAKKQTSHVFQTPFSNRPSFSNRDSKSDLWNSLESEKTQLSSSIKTINGDPKQANKHTHILIVFSRLVDPSTWNRRAFGSCCLFVLFSVIRWSWLLSFLLLICAVKSLFELWRWEGIFVYIDFISLSVLFSIEEGVYSLPFWKDSNGQNRPFLLLVAGETWSVVLAFSTWGKVAWQPSMEESHKDGPPPWLVPIKGLKWGWKFFGVWVTGGGLGMHDHPCRVINFFNPFV